MAAAPLKHWAILTGLLLTACGDAAQGPAGADPVAAAGDPDTAVASAADPAPSPVHPTMTSPVGPAVPSDCNAPKAEPFIGQTATPAVRERLAAAVAPIATIRWVGPGQATTEDYSPQRLNVMLDVGGAITEVHCG
ncbi:hypothetical protein GRI75_03995 [Altererythrobacter soli]|uniref:Peptidase inhibitor I78 n=1 Tax=Croceibacterium soli TaxID=1739690 RepID=A0A6I4USY9_9SPHN|nr:I78 family peptidase inhibitor [Croceibacterium soli]MXP40809.1 hypothetical protein [Croceibacterium soli]